jgi:hypothetical protein
MRSYRDGQKAKACQKPPSSPDHLATPRLLRSSERMMWAAQAAVQGDTFLVAAQLASLGLAVSSRSNGRDSHAS